MPPSTRVKKLFDRVAPFVYRPLRGAYHRFSSWRFQKRYRALVDRLVAGGGWRVRSGPFHGMAYVQEARSSALLPKLLGTYEDEIHESLAELLKAAPDVVVDIGAAEGYYAVGLARRLPGAIVHAFDLEERSRSLCAEMAALNLVADRVMIRAKFTPELLPELPPGRKLVICDVDGYEMELFAPGLAPYWKDADLIVELHDFLGKPCAATVRGCLEATHQIEIIASRDKEAPSLPELAAWPADDQRLAVCEIRPPQHWLIARPHGSAAGR
jgi:hypothetical protein